MDLEEALQQAIEEQPGAEAAWPVLADWLDDQGQPDRAELLRLQVRLRGDLGSPGRDALQRRLQALLRGGTYPWAPRRQIRLGRGAELTLVLVPPGRFYMGSDDAEL